MKTAAIGQMPLFETPAPVKATVKNEVVLHMQNWCWECRRNPGTCKKSVKGMCQNKTLNTRKFDNVVQCAEFILTSDFDEAFILVISENDNPRSVAVCKTEIPIGGYAPNVKAWAREVLA